MQMLMIDKDNVELFKRTDKKDDNIKNYKKINEIITKLYE
jgi:hypothetical protein